MLKKFFKAFEEAIRGTEKEFTSGSIRRAIFMLSIPMILEMVMESLFAVVDIFFVGMIAEDATAAVATVGLTESVITLVYAVAIGLSMAATAMVARRIGEKQPEAAAAAAAQAIFFVTVVAVLLGIAGFWYAEDVLALMGGEPRQIELGVGYTRILFASNIVIMLLFLLNGVFRGAGDASIAMRSLWLANGLNILLDPLFIFALDMGIQGAAVATMIGRGCGVAFQLYILFNGKGIIKLKLQDFKVHWEVLKKLISVGATGAGQFLIASASWIFLMRILSAEFGKEVVAGFTISMRVIMFTILPSWGLSNAAATLVGQNLGANQPERAEQSVWKTAHYNTLFLLIISVIFFVFAPQIIGIFSAESIVINAGVSSLRIMCVGYVAFSYGMVISQAFNGAGDTRTPTWINFFCFWMIEIPLAYLLAVNWEVGHVGVYLAIAIAETVLAILCIYLFRKGNWKKVQV